MSNRAYKIEELIKLVDERNTFDKELPLLGINLSKQFFPSVANVIGTDMSRYKVIRKGRFACNMMHVGRDLKVPVALYCEDKEALISPAYPMFTVSDENIIIPEYLMLFFKNTEFDREAGFYASAGIRGGFEWEDFCNVTMSVPSIEEQRRIVNEYQTVERRIANNEKLIQKLEETAQAIYYHTFVEGIDENNLPLSRFCTNVTDGVHNTVDDTEDGEYFLLSSKNIGNNCLSITDNERKIDKSTFDKLRKRTKLAKGDVLITSVGTIGKLLLILNEPNNYEFQRSVAIVKPLKDYYSAFIYESLKYRKRELVETAHGAVQQCIFIDDVKNFMILAASDEKIMYFDMKVAPIFDYVNSLHRELIHLRELLTLLTSKLA